MRNDLQAVFKSLVRYHVATPANPLPPPQPGITWIWAANGVFKRGVNDQIDALIRVSLTTPIPGLERLLPTIRWAGCSGRISGALLISILVHAQRAVQVTGGVGRPLEQQYFIIRAPSHLRVVCPAQEATSGHITYRMPHGQVLIDIHSHHAMRAYFSATDSHDDSGLSISAVIGRIFSPTPEIIVRANVYGHHMPLPALMIFDRLGPFHDIAGGAHAGTHD